MFSFFRKKAPPTAASPGSAPPAQPPALTAAGQDAEPVAAPPPETGAERSGWIGRLAQGLRKTGSSLAQVFTGTKIDDALYEELESALLMADAGVAATEVLVPIQCEYYALEGLGQLTRNVDLVQRNLNADLEISAIVLVMYDSRTRLGEQVASEVREHFGGTVCRNVIPRNIRLSEAPSFGKPITTFDPSSRGAVAYRELAREVSGGT